jgi:REP element-mobilizing transposase RayT
LLFSVATTPVVSSSIWQRDAAKIVNILTSRRWALPLHERGGMARPLRIEFPHAVHHVMSRGNAKQTVFLDHRDRRLFLSTLWEICDRLDWDVWAYCLMPNHYHLLIQTHQRNFSRGMRDLNGRYAMAFNTRHDRVGHLFQGRFQSVLVDRNSHLLELTRYIVLNPVQAGLCDRPEAWRWSSYRAVLGLASPPPRLSCSATLALFSSDAPEACRTYAEFVLAGAATKHLAWSPVPTIAGDDQFIASIEDHVAHPSREVPRAERALKPIAAYEIEARSRNEAIRAAYESGNYRQADIARYFGLHYTTVCRILGNSSCHDAKKQDLTP